jgi:hypothetical protein
LHRHNGNNNGGNHHNNTHHPLPQSKYPELADDPWNKASVVEREHGVYHFFFNNDPPKKIARKIMVLFPKPIALLMIIYLNKRFWKNLYEVDVNRKSVIKALFKIEKVDKNRSRIVVKWNDRNNYRRRKADLRKN